MPYANSNGVKIYYEEAGRGFPLVLAHEFGGDYRSWEDQFRYFSRRYRVIAYNSRGFPPSDTPAELDAYSQAIFVEDMANLMRHLKIDKAHIAGLSMGSMTTLHFGVTYPQMARSLVISGTGPGDTKRAKDRFESEIVGFIKNIEANGWKKVAENYGLSDDRLWLRDKNPRGYDEFVKQLEERLTTGPLQALRRVVTGRPLLADMQAKLRAMRVPTLILLGDEDHVCIDTGLWLKRLLPAAGLHVLPKTGHTTNLEEPTRFSEAMADFFTAVEDGRWPETPPASRESY